MIYFRGLTEIKLPFTREQRTNKIASKLLLYMPIKVIRYNQTKILLTGWKQSKLNCFSSENWVESCWWLLGMLLVLGVALLLWLDEKVTSSSGVILMIFFLQYLMETKSRRAQPSFSDCYTSICVCWTILIISELLNYINCSEWVTELELDMKNVDQDRLWAQHNNNNNNTTKNQNNAASPSSRWLWAW